MRHLSKRWISLFLAVALTLGMVTLPASAEDSEEKSESEETAVEEEEEEETPEELQEEKTATEETVSDETEAEDAAEEEEAVIEGASGDASTWYENGLARGLYQSPVLAPLAGIKFQNETIADILNMSQDPDLEEFSFSTFFANTVFADLTYEDLLAYYEAGYEDMNEVLTAMTSSSSRRKASSSMQFASSYTLTGTASTIADVYMSAYGGAHHGRMWMLKLGGYNALCLDYGYGASSGTTYNLVSTSSKLSDEQVYLLKTGIIYALLFNNSNGNADITENIVFSTDQSEQTYYIILQLWCWGIMAGLDVEETADSIYDAWYYSFNDTTVGTFVRDTIKKWWAESRQDEYDLDNFEIALYWSGDSTDQYLLMYDFDTLSLNNNYGQIELTKSGAKINSANLSGAVYTIYSDSNCTEEVTTITTDSSGYGISAKFEVDTSLSNYYVKETTAPTGTLLNDTVYSVSADALTTAYDEGEAVNLNDLYGDIENEPWSGRFIVRKTDAETGESLRGAVFGVYYGSDYQYLLEYLTYDEGGEYYYSSTMYYSTNNNGQFRIVEISAPEGYENSGWYTDIVLTQNESSANAVEYSFDVTNGRNTGGVSIQKVDADTQAAIAQGNADLAGAIYVIEDADTGEEVTRITTDETGYAATESNDLSYGDYIIYEVTASTGYTVDETAIAFTVDTANEIVALTDEAGEEVTSKESVIRGGVIIQKSDYQTGAAVLLAGTEFTIYNASDNAVVVDGVSYEPGEAVLVLTTNGTGIAATDSDALPYGAYTVVETKAPAGYTIFGITSLEFSITEDGEMVDLSGTNGILDQGIRGDFSFNKKDFETQENMAGVSFLITSDATGESHIVTTDENGYYSSSSDYVLHSTNTNEGTAGSGLWFGYDTSGNWAEVDDELGALPYGTYTYVELAGDNNVGKKLVSGTITITAHGYTVELGDIQRLSRLPLRR